jgi:rare lipoprotein A
MLPWLKVKPMQVNQMLSLSPLLEPRSLAQHPCTGGVNTASGERYDSSEWAAAIKTNLRNEFGGVQYGARPKYALVEGAGRKAIIKINDVGPLTPGRIIDFNERTMRYFDPSLLRGVIDGVKVTPLFGDWTPGPVDA